MKTLSQVFLNIGFQLNKISWLEVEKQTLNATLEYLKHFARYVICVSFIKNTSLLNLFNQFIQFIACQNFSEDLNKFSDKYFSKGEEFNNNSYKAYVNSFRVTSYCSAPSLIVVRILPNGKKLF